MSYEGMSKDWKAPPPYEIAAPDANFSSELLENGRISMLFESQGSNDEALPPLTKKEPLPGTTSSTAEAVYPLINIVIQVVGSRGVVQPFIVLGQELQRVGHRVRIATHNAFQDFILSNGLEFFPIGGDPTELMEYMVKNPGIIPNLTSIHTGSVSQKRKMIHEILEGCWKSCIQRDPLTNTPFIAEAIIANPPSFAHIHCAQALGIPVHLMFTMPWSVTRVFPHPLANVRLSGVDKKMGNILSYGLVSMITWQGTGDIINNWRQKTLNLAALPTMIGVNLADYLQVPFTYCWSPALIPKPFDWPSHIAVCGFFLRSTPSYTPPPELGSFLKAGPPPIYIGFGSIVMGEPERMTRIILDAVRICGIRAAVSRGWSKLGTGAICPENVLFIEDCPHEWLFKYVKAVVHHGGAGTTACGLINGLPTAIIPFFGDQPFWSNVVSTAGAGPPPIDHKLLDSASLAKAINICLSSEAVHAAQVLSERMREENGVRDAVTSFHGNLPIQSMSCDMIPQQPAAWCWKKGDRKLKLSHQAAAILVESKKVEASALELHQTKPISIENKRWDPVTGTLSAFFNGIFEVGSAVGTVTDPSAKTYQQVKGGEEHHTGDSSLKDGKSEPGPSNKSPSSFGPGLRRVGMAVGKMAVDLPLAMADGLHNIPVLYGDKVRDLGPIRDWKSGSVVGVKSFGYGFYDGYTGLFSKPYEGARDSGSIGFLKGLGKGAIGFLSQNGSAIFGVVSYPALGLYRSLDKSSRNGTQGEILKAHKDWGIYVAQKSSLNTVEVERVLRDFDTKWLAVREPI